MTSNCLLNRLHEDILRLKGRALQLLANGTAAGWVRLRPSTWAKGNSNGQISRLMDNQRGPFNGNVEVQLADALARSR